MRIFKTDLKAFFYFLLLGVISTAGLLGVVFPATLLGKNIFLVLPFFIVALLIFYSSIYRNRKVMAPINLCFALLAIFLALAILMQSILYNQVLGFFAYRFVFQIAFAAALTLAMVSSIGRERVQYVVMSVIILVSLIQGLGYFFFPEVQVIRIIGGPARITFDGEATRNGLLGSSIVAYHAVLGLFLLTTNNRPSALKLLATVFFVLVIVSTLTRIAIIFMLILLLRQVTSKVGIKALVYALSSVLIFFFLVSFMDVISGRILMVLERFDIDFVNDPRVTKAILTFDLIFNSLSGFLWGLPTGTLNSATLDGFQVSDNSFFLVLLRFGFIFGVVWVGSMVYLILRFNRIGTLYWVWIITSLATTNSIAWDSFIFCLIALASVLGKSASGKKPDSLIEKPNFA